MQLVLDLLVQVWHDALRQQTGTVPADQLAYPQVAQVSAQLAQRLPTDRLLTIMTRVLETHGQLAGNVNFQNILEALTLEILEQVNH